MLKTGFRKGKIIEDSGESKDFLLRQLEIAHKKEDNFGKYIILIKGWAVTLLTAMIRTS